MPNQASKFLRLVLRIDAVTCVLSGLASLLLANVLAAPLGLPAGLLQVSGAILLGFAGLIAFAASRVPALRWPVWLVVIGNAVWALDSVLLLVSDSVQPSALGTSYVIAQALAVVVLAELEYTGLRRTAARTVSAA
jgi:hypothetical protein